MRAQDEDKEMIPEPPNGEYLELTNGIGLPGQNSPTPAEKLFGNHVFLKFNGLYYDPSYKQVYQDPQDFQDKAIFGFGTPKQTIFGRKRWAIEVKNALHVSFSEESC